MLWFLKERVGGVLQLGHGFLRAVSGSRIDFIVARLKLTSFRQSRDGSVILT